jgi:hypothetical protein
VSFLRDSEFSREMFPARLKCWAIELPELFSPIEVVRERDHCSRSAVIGFVRAARLAGINVAKIETAARTDAAKSIVVGS